MSEPRCDNCNELWRLHCAEHLIPCCPHYRVHDLLAGEDLAAEYRAEDEAMERLAEAKETAGFDADG